MLPKRRPKVSCPPGTTGSDDRWHSRAPSEGPCRCPARPGYPRPPTCPRRQNPPRASGARAAGSRRLVQPPAHHFPPVAEQRRAWPGRASSAPARRDRSAAAQAPPGCHPRAVATECSHPRTRASRALPGPCAATAPRRRRGPRRFRSRCASPRLAGPLPGVRPLPGSVLPQAHPAAPAARPGRRRRTPPGGRAPLGPRATCARRPRGRPLRRPGGPARPSAVWRRREAAPRCGQRG